MKQNKKPYNKGKGKQNYKKSGQYYEKQDRRGSNSGSSHDANGYLNRENDPSWYNKESTLVHDVTKVPFTNQVGRPLNLNNGGTEFDDINVPGILALRYVCGPGKAVSPSDGVNIAATALFQDTRSKLATVADYHAADQMMAVLAVDSIITMYNHMMRLFGVSKLFSSLNYNYSDALLRALGMSEASITDFRGNMGNYIAKFNQLAYKASQLRMPVTYAITDRHAWLFSNIFTDGVSPKSQIYVHVPAGFYFLDETVSEEGTALVYAPVSEDMTFGDYLESFNTMLERIRNSDSMNKIFSDMRRAFEASNWTFPYITDAYIVSPTFSMEVLSQIENTTILPELDDEDDYKTAWVTQDVSKNYVKYNPQFVTGLHDSAEEYTFSDQDYVNACVPNNVWSGTPIINMHWDNPSSDDIAVATRNTVTLKITERINRMVAESLGCDFCVGAKFYIYSTNVNGDHLITYDLYRFITTDHADDVHISNQVKNSVISHIVAFDWAPQIFFGVQDPNLSLIHI